MEQAKILKGIARAKGYSFKYVKLGGGFGQGWHFGAVPDLIDAAVTGRFVSTRW